MKTHRLSRISGALILALGVSTSALANETSSSVNGKILTPQGTPAANTKVIITHIPSGTVKVVETNEAGIYSARGLRVGGPYKIVFDSNEFKDQQHDNLFLEVGKPFRLSADLEGNDIETIEVVGSRVVGYTNNGSSGSWGSEEILSSAGGNRDLKDILRANPLVTLGTDGDGSLSIAGSNPRYNSFSVDGVRQNDDFGLNSNGYPTQRSPISIDAVEQVSVETSPFSVRNGGFSGGQINAVTKSGTNEFHGSLYYQTESDSLAGTPKDPSGRDVELDFEETTYSFTLGGPIIKDKLFFFASYENFDKPAQLEFGPAGANAPNDTRASLEDYNKVRDIAQSVYGVDIGTWDAQPQEKDEKILVKLDWTINDDHRAALTYQNTEGNVTRNTSSSSSELRLSTHWYDKEEKLTTLAGHLYSTWSDDFSTEVKVAWKESDTAQAPANKGFGDITVRTASGDIAFGPDQYRHGNELDNETISVRFLGEYLMDEHEISFGFEYETIDVRNLFAPNSLGQWRFNSIDDFEARNASSFTYANAFTNNVEDAAAEFTFSTTTLFVEDSFYLLPELYITAGIRYEVIGSDDAPAHNANFQERYGFSNSTNLDGEGIFLPRVAFEWEAAEDITVRGGIGRFSGGRPNVWLSNAYSNDGITYVTASNTRNFLSNVDITQIPQGVQSAMVAGDGNVNVTDPDFELPSDWRTSIGVDYIVDIPGLGDEYLFTAEYIYVAKENDVFWVDLTREFAGVTAGGRKVYQPIDKLTGEPTQRYDLMLTNARKDGESKIFTTSLSKSYDNGLSFNMSYTNQDITEGTPGTSSTATSNFQYPVTMDRNHVEIGRGNFETEHSFKLSLNYTANFVEDYETRFNLFFERRSGNPISWVLGSHDDYVLGDQGSFGRSDAYLPYIPSGENDPNVVYDGGLTYAEFSDYLKQAGLTKYAGGYAPKGAGRAPWVTRLDLSIVQEIPGFAEGHKGELYLTINNLANLIDSDSGKALRSEFGTHILADYDVDAEGRYVYSTPFGGFNGQNWTKFDAEESAWTAKIGVRYKF